MNCPLSLLASSLCSGKAHPQLLLEFRAYQVDIKGAPPGTERRRLAVLFLGGRVAVVAMAGVFCDSQMWLSN